MSTAKRLHSWAHKKVYRPEDDSLLGCIGMIMIMPLYWAFKIYIRITSGEWPDTI